MPLLFRSRWPQRVMPRDDVAADSFRLAPCVCKIIRTNFPQHIREMFLGLSGLM